ncbi:folate-binding protein [uncultured Thiodictyon sp.]|uniref:CAF17-like 4Fe-4S cluster assembly/insertion protein YgfZ n=1 Tax=uncultured Thiodictyon sp. TaxID=1846217 RepID=UPI0025F8CCDA|nr:folate-binding protein [uncultured Thiodictyon sp.]
MNPDWRAFLTARGAPNATGAAAADCTRYDLSHLGLIAVQGADADGFLQGQLSNDIRILSATRCQLSAHCSPKGRMLDLFLALRLPDGIGLQLPRERVAPAIKRLGLYVLRSKVTLLEHSDGPVRIGLAGTGAARELERLGLPVPEQNFAAVTADAVTVLRLPGTPPRFELIAECARQIDLWDALAPVSAWGDADAWALLDIRAGIPSVYTATSDAFVPQMANLQLLNGVSFTKGCYTGQEVVARMQYLGTLKRRMYWAEVETDIPPQPGDALESAASTSEQGAGRVVDARRSGDGRYELLAVAEIAAAETGEVRLGADGPPLRLQAPPYGFQAPAG